MQRRTISPAGWGVIGLAAVVVVAAIIAGVIALTGDKPGQGSDAGVLHAEHDPVADDPHLAAHQAASTMFTFTPAEQDYPEQGLSKIQDSLTGQLAHLATNSPDNPKLLPEPWEDWKNNGDRVYANVEQAGEVRHEGEDTAIVPLKISQVIAHPSDETTPWKTFGADFRVTKVDGRWKADSWEYKPLTDQ